VGLGHLPEEAGVGRGAGADHDAACAGGVGGLGEARSRMPPPNCTLGPSAAMRRKVGRLSGAPPNAPSRSTTWIHSAPAWANLIAGSTGSW
jgi:hypothetical protein